MARNRTLQWAAIKSADEHWSVFELGPPLEICDTNTNAADGWLSAFRAFKGALVYQLPRAVLLDWLANSILEEAVGLTTFKTDYPSATNRKKTTNG